MITYSVVMTAICLALIVLLANVNESRANWKFAAEDWQAAAEERAKRACNLATELSDLKTQLAAKMKKIRDITNEVYKP